MISCFFDFFIWRESKLKPKIKVNKKTVLIIIIGLMLALTFFISPILNNFKKCLISSIESYFESTISMDVLIDDITLSGLNRIKIRGVDITANEESDLFEKIQIDSIEITYNIKELFGQNLDAIKSIEKIFISDFKIISKFDKEKQISNLKFDEIQSLLIYAFDLVMNFGFKGFLLLDDGQIEIKRDEESIIISNINVESEISDKIIINNLIGQIYKSFISITGFLGLDKSDDLAYADIMINSDYIDVFDFICLDKFTFLDKEISQIIKDLTLCIYIKDKIYIEDISLNHQQAGEVAGSMEFSLDFPKKNGELLLMSDFKGEIFVRDFLIHELFEGILNAELGETACLSMNFNREEINISLFEFKINNSDMQLQANIDFQKNLKLEVNLDNSVIYGDGKIVDNEFEKFKIEAKNISLKVLKTIGLQINDMIEKQIGDVIISAKAELNGKLNEIHADFVLDVNIPEKLTDYICNLKSIVIPVHLNMSSNTVDVKETCIPTCFGNFTLSGIYEYNGNNLSAKVDVQKANLSNITGYIKENFENEDKEDFEIIDGYIDTTLIIKYDFKCINNLDPLSGLYVDIYVNDGTINIIPVKAIIDKIKGSFVLGADTLRIEDFTAISGNGKINVSGIVGIGNFFNDNQKIDVNIDFNDIAIDKYGVYGDLNGGIFLKNYNGKLNIYGTIYTSNLTVKIDSVQKTVSSNTNNTNFLNPYWYDLVKLNVSLISNEKMKIKGEWIDITVDSCEFKLGGVLSAPVITGHAFMTDGKARIVGTDFDIINGRVFFDNISPLIPNIDIHAKTRLGVNDNLQLHVNGPINELKVELDGQDRSRTDEIKAGIMKLLGSKARLYIVYDLEETLVKKGFIDDAELFVNTDDKLSLQVGKTISDDIYISYTRELSLDGDNLISIDYQITPNITMKGGFSGQSGTCIGFDSKFIF